MKLCSYVIKGDTGLAPNPFHGYCTNALCTPSHMNARLVPGDWLMGNSPKADGNRLVYAMRISEVLHMNDYFHDPRFQKKKQEPLGKKEEQCGDNFYYRKNGDWKRLPSRFHNNPTLFVQDVGKNRTGRPVFVAKLFYYFGDKRVSIPQRLRRVIRGVQGIQYTEGHLVDDFLLWLEANHSPGVIGRPKDMEDRSDVLGTMITDPPSFGSLAATGPTLQYSSPATPRGRFGGCR
jgi:hypothetical protein